VKQRVVSASCHAGVRVALEPPRGLKPTLLRSYASLPAGCLSSCNSCGRGQQWQRLVFVAALLHGLLKVRNEGTANPILLYLTTRNSVLPWLLILLQGR
jgi:hypothetical protein